MSLNMRYVPYGEHGAHYGAEIELEGAVAACEVSGSPAPWEDSGDGGLPDGRCHATCHVLAQGAPASRAVLVCDDECGSYAEAAALLESVAGRAARGEFDRLLGL